MTKGITQGSKKMLWFTAEQLEQLKELKEITGLGNSELIRKAMELLLIELKGDK